LHGGPWLDPGTCAHYLERFLNGGGLAFVAEVGGRVVAECELSLAEEPAPHGRNLNLNTLYVHRNHQGQGLGSALMQHALKLATQLQCDTFQVAHAEAPKFYQRHGLTRAERWVQMQISLRPTHRSAPTTQPLPNGSYDLVRGQALLIGRYQNAHHDWERTRPNAVPDFDEWRHLKLERHTLTVNHRNAHVIYEEEPDHAATANLFLFTQVDGTNPDDGQLDELLSTVCQLGVNLGFTYLYCFCRSDLKLPEANPTDYEQQLFMKRL
jgi:predicted N-acetyltransferase YhbS